MGYIMLKHEKLLIIALLFLFVIFLVPFARAFVYDLSISIVVPTFTLDNSGQYKLIVLNNETAPEYINFSAEYYIMQNNEYVSGYPKTTHNSLKEQKTITRSWTPQNSGEFKICAKVFNETAEEASISNNFACVNVLIGGNESKIQENSSTQGSSSADENANNTGDDSADASPYVVNSSKNTSTSESILKDKNLSTLAESNKSNSSEKTQENQQTQSAQKNIASISGEVIYESKGEIMKKNALHLALLLIVFVLIYAIMKKK